MAYQPVRAVAVNLWGRRVGATAYDERIGAYTFRYTPEWAASGPELAPLLMPTDPKKVYEFRTLNRETYYGLAPLLADALPDRFGNAVMNAWLAEQGIRREQITPLDRLAYTGQRGMGALTFEPAAGIDRTEVAAIQLATLVTEARKVISGSFATDEARTDALRQLLVVGSSAGGARAKAIIGFNPETSEVVPGNGDLPAGFDHWLLKLDGVADETREDVLGGAAGFGRIEYAYYLMARAAGLDISESRLLPEGPRAHFMTRRFDRENGMRHHVLTLCGMAHLDFNEPRAHSYAQYLDVIGQLGLGADALEQAFRRVVFNVAAVNRDDHTKNLAFRLREDTQTWELAPAYDITHAHNPNEGKWTVRHQMSVGGKFDQITLADLRELADRYAVPRYEPAIADVLDAVERFGEFADEADLPEDHRRRIAADLDRYRPT